jgi:hypothetical protein
MSRTADSPNAPRALSPQQAAAEWLARAEALVAKLEGEETRAHEAMRIANRYGWGVAASDRWAETARSLELAQAGLRAALRANGLLAAR